MPTHHPDRPPAIDRDVVLVVAAGGALGSVARWLVSVALPTDPKAMPWSTVTVNIVGSLLMGVLVVLASARWPGHRLVRPFLAAGVLGGFTTFSTYVLDAQGLIDAGAVLAAVAYLAITLVGGLLAVWLGSAATEAVLRREAPR